jgi:hypothetical protein
MTFKELVEEAAARGFADMLDGGSEQVRLKRYVNQAAREIYDLADWPFLNALKEGTAPLTIADLAHVLSVSNLVSGGTLDPADERQVTEGDPDRNEVGTAEQWYRASLTQIGVWPADTASKLVVRYVKQPVDMVADSDEPLSPATYHDLIVDGTEVRCQKKRKNYEAAQFIRQEWERGIRGMRHALLKPNYDRERSIIRTGGSGDYLG